MVVDQIIGAESGGNPYARNPRSSAGGSGQFIDATWLELVKQRRPDIAQGKTDAQLLQLKFDPNLSREMTQAYADQNAEFLRGKGIEPTPGNTYLAHFAGPSGAAAIHADPGKTVELLLGPQAVAANPFLKGKTGADVIDWAASKMSPAQHMAKKLRARFGTGTEGGAAPPAVAAEAGGMERLKAALGGKTYDPDKLSGADRLIDQGQQIAGGSGNAIGAIGGTILAGLGGYERSQERGNEKAYRAELGQTLGGVQDPMEAARVLMASPDPKLQEAGIALFVKATTAAQRAGQESFSKSVTYGINDAGETVPLQFSDRGRGVEAALPPGLRLGGKDPIRIDAGTHEVLLDPVTRQVIGQVPKDVAGAAREGKIGAAEGVNIAEKPQARQSLGAAFSNFDRLAEQARALRSAEGLEAMTGFSSYAPFNIRQSTADAEAQLNTLKSQIATNVLQAMREASKTGGALGAVSEKEFAALENNLASLETAQSMPAFQASLDRIAEFAEGAKQRLGQAYEETYGEAFQPQAPARDAGGGGGGGPRRMRYNPETGELE